ncbi:beta-galactosidase [Sphingomonas zeicaulis]|uniref:glycoside hydrolase family 2 TIM barrel-domain containing protein n=1 Tax=Sphingomonas zeicaulis TaxID=1632740 RepID=UPI003D215426
MRSTPIISATAPSRREVLALGAVPVALAAGGAGSAIAAPPRVSRSATAAQHSLDGIWKFRIDPYSQGVANGWSAPSLDESGWEDIAVPGVWDMLNHHADYIGEAWYRTSFATEPAWAGKLVRLKFDGIYNHATVWLNGREIGTNDMGYLPFHIDLAMLAPAGGRNQLTVRADNRFKLGAVWNWGGIRRPVTLDVTAPSRIEQVRIVSVPDLATGRARVRVDARAVCHAALDPGLTARLTIRSGGVAIWESPPDEPAKRAGKELDFTFEADLSAEQVRLWHFNAPNLYEADVVLMRGEAAVHALADRFGIREVRVDGDRLLLNGEPVRAVGFNLVPEDRRTGSVLPASRIRADIDHMKMLGANMARLSHLPLPGEFLDYLDEVGMLTVDEVPIWGQNALVDAESKVAARWLERLIDTHRNHPSIIAWCVGNEIGFYDKNPGVKGYVRTAIARARAQDPSRMAIYVTHSAARQADDPVQFCDMILMNAYGDLSEGIEKTRRLHPGKPIFLSEYGDSLDGEDPNRARNMADTFLKQMRGRPYVMGGSLWTFADYRSSWAGGPGSPPTAPSQNRSWGVLTADRRPKRSYYTYRTAHAPVRELSVAPQADGWAITLAPRAADDLPAYKLRGWRLLWRVLGVVGEPVDAGVLDVPALDPGAAAVTLRTAAARRGAAFAVDLVDPSGFSVLTVTRNLQPPAPPAIRAVHSSAKTIRAVFDRVPRAEDYVLICSGPDGETRSAPTINDFAEIGDLVQGKSYSLRLVAVNDAGESGLSAAVRATTNHEVLPPVVWAVEPANGAIIVHHASEGTDYLYDVELTEAGGASRVVSASTRGTTRIPGVTNDKAYRLRMRRCNGLGFWSAWTAPIPAIAQGVGGLPAPARGFVVAMPGGTMLAFDPVANAAAYEAKLDGRTVRINRSASGIALLAGAAPGRVSLRAIDDHGQAGAAVELRRLGGEV